VRAHVVAWLAQWLPLDVARLIAPTWYTMVGIAGLLTLVVLLRHARRDGIDRAAVATAVIVSYVAAIVGGIAMPALLAMAEAALDGRSVRPRFVGMTSYWGYLAGTIAMVEACRRGAVPLGWLADRATAVLGVALALVRTGCFLAGCDYGKLTSGPWAVRFPRGAPAWRDHVERGLVPVTRDASLPVHPTQLYEAAVGVVIAIAAALWCRSRARVGTGRVFLAAVAAYCAARLGVEALRGDRLRGFLGPVSSGQVFALMVLAAIAAVVAWSRRPAPGA